MIVLQRQIRQEPRPEPSRYPSNRAALVSVRLTPIMNVEDPR